MKIGQNKGIELLWSAACQLLQLGDNKADLASMQGAEAREKSACEKRRTILRNPQKVNICVSVGEQKLMIGLNGNGRFYTVDGIVFTSID